MQSEKEDKIFWARRPNDVIEAIYNLSKKQSDIFDIILCKMAETSSKKILALPVTDKSKAPSIDNTIDSAKLLVDNLPNSATKTDLVAKLEEVRQSINNINITSDSNIEEDNVYQVNVRDYSKIFDICTTNIYRDLKLAANELEGAGFHLVDDNGNLTRYNWFASIKYIDKFGIVEFQVSKKLKEIFLEMKEKKKKRIIYDIKYPINLTHIYSKRMYYYLKSFEDTKWRIDNLEVLRTKMDCPISYNKYSLFKQKVLDVAYKEINENTDIKFEYTPIKNKNKVVRLEFTITTNAKIIPVDFEILEYNTITIESPTVHKANVHKSPSKKIERDDDIFISTDEILKVHAIFSEHSITDADAIEIFKLAQYSLPKIKKGYAYTLPHKPKNIIPYMRKVMKEFNSNPVLPVQTSLWNSIPQRSYDYDELERQLLGIKNN